MSFDNAVCRDCHHEIQGIPFTMFGLLLCKDCLREREEANGIRK